MAPFPFGILLAVVTTPNHRRALAILFIVYLFGRDREMHPKGKGLVSKPQHSNRPPYADPGGRATAFLVGKDMPQHQGDAVVLFRYVYLHLGSCQLYSPHSPIAQSSHIHIYN